MVTIGPVDPMQEKIAAGCHTAEACAALKAEAHARGDRCVADPRGDDCEARLRDLTAADTLASTQANADRMMAVNLGLSAPVETASAASDREAQYRADVERFGDSCEDVAALADAGAHRPDADVAQLYANLVATRRTTETNRRLKDLQQILHRADYVSRDRDDPTVSIIYEDQIRQAVAMARSIAQEIRCYDEAAGKAATTDVDAWANGLETSIADEKACMAKPQCLADRLLPSLCETIGMKREALAGIAREKRNPSGFVDMRLLRDLGEDVQNDEDRLRELRARYLKVAHKAFNDERCSRPGQ